ncbi:MAG: alpha/beta fold hydrolase [Candidatus Hodarchaeales archaeon]|jgi:pimeloyl-ACP methyl ester carboxylesterase
MANRNIDATNKSHVRYINPHRAVPFQIRSLRFGFKVVSSISTRLGTKMAIKAFYRPRKSPFRKSELEKLATAKTFSFVYKNFKLQTYTWGEGKPLLLIHGWDGKGIDFLNMIDPLVQAGYRVTTVDMPGHGKSTGNNIDMTDFVGSILLMQDKFGEFDNIIAHSFGGLATLTTLIREKLSVKKMVLISSPTSVDTVMSSFQAILELKEEIIENIRIDAYNRTGLTMTNFPSKEQIPKITSPTLLIHDTHDMIIPVNDANKLNTLLPNSKLIKTAGLGHQKILKDSQVISNIISFLTNP